MMEDILILLFVLKGKLLILSLMLFLAGLRSIDFIHRGSYDL